jgi:hypothetical protein
MIPRYTSGYITNPETTNLSLRPSSGLSVRGGGTSGLSVGGGTRYFYPPKMVFGTS